MKIIFFSDEAFTENLAISITFVYLFGDHCLFFYTTEEHSAMPSIGVIVAIMKSFISEVKSFPSKKL